MGNEFKLGGAPVVGRSLRPGAGAAPAARGILYYIILPP